MAPSDNGADAFVAAVERQILTPAEQAFVPDADIERVMTAAVRLYAARCEAAEKYPPPVSAEAVSATDIVITVSEMIRAVDLNLFDLMMWFRGSKASGGRGE